MTAALDDPTSAEVRYYAYAALTLPGMAKITPQAPLLIKILKDPEQNQFRRSRAALHLNKRGDASVVDPLIVALPLSLLTAVVVALVTPRMDAAHVNYVFGGPKPGAK